MIKKIYKFLRIYFSWLWYKNNGYGNKIPTKVKAFIILKLHQKTKYGVFIETGTFLGDMIHAIYPFFKTLYSIELSQKLAKTAQNNFILQKNIKILQGDSTLILPQVLAQLAEPAIFWLDGHFSGATTAKGKLNTPILAEIEAIAMHPIKQHVIAIDDIHLFNGENDYPKKEDFIALIKNSFPNHQQIFIANMMIIKN